MYYVRLKWLTWLQVAITAFAIATVVIYALPRYYPDYQWLYDFWGVNLTVVTIAIAAIGYTLTLYIRLREKSVWSAHIIGLIFMILMMAVLLETTGSGAYTSWVFGVWITTAFYAAMLGPYPPIVMVILNIIGFILAASGAFKDDSLLFGPFLIMLVSLSGFCGWYVFRNRYVQKNGEDSRLSRLSSMLKEEQLKSEILIESIADGVVVVDTQGAVQLFNPAAAAMTGWHVDEALGLDCRSILVFYDLHDTNVTDTANPFSAVLDKGQHITQDKIKLATRSGNKLFLSLTISPIVRHDTGEIAGAIAIFRDISKQHQEDQRKADFISTASHEMRTPVAAIEGFLALAMNPAVSKVDAKALEYLTKAHTASQHLGQLFQDLLTISRAEDGRLENHPQVVEVGALLRELVEQWHFAADEKKLHVITKVGNQSLGKADSRMILPMFYTYVDPERIREVLTNLFDNAVKYTPQGSVTVQLDGNSDAIQISIIDTGQGIAREDIPHLFQKFYRVDNSATRQIGGTGLGLYICRQIINMYQGNISVESEIGKGSTFTVSLPRLSADEVEQKKKETASNTDANATQVIPAETAAPAPVPVATPPTTVLNTAIAPAAAPQAAAPAIPSQAKG